MYKITIVFGKNDEKTFHNITHVKMGIINYFDDKISNMELLDNKPIYLYDNSGKSYLIPKNSFKYITCEPETE